MKEVYIEIGQTLKNYRLKRKLTLEKISNKTKISIQNLNNIENGNLHLIAGEFYQRSFIKSYVEALRISEKKILLLLHRHWIVIVQKIMTSLLLLLIPLILIPFEAEFKDHDGFDKNNKKHKHKDPKKFEKLQSSAQELLIWLIKGAIDWYANGLGGFPDKIRNATERYKLESDELYNFLNDEDICELPPTDVDFDKTEYFTTTHELLDKFISEMSYKCTKKEFRDMMLKHGHKEIKYKSKKGFKIKLI